MNDDKPVLIDEATEKLQKFANHHCKQKILSAILNLTQEGVPVVEILRAQAEVIGYAALSYQMTYEDLYKMIETERPAAQKTFDKTSRLLEETKALAEMLGRPMPAPPSPKNSDN